MIEGLKGKWLLHFVYRIDTIGHQDSTHFARLTTAHPLIKLLPPVPPRGASLPRLATIRPSPRRLLIPRHARPKLNVDARRRREPKRFRHFREVELVDVEHAAEGV